MPRLLSIVLELGVSAVFIGFGLYEFRHADKIQQRYIRWFDRHPGPKLFQPFIRFFSNYYSSPQYITTIKRDGILGIIFGILILLSSPVLK